MCRVLSYLGTPILMEELLYFPDNSFIKQSYHPIHMSHLLNLAGFGMIAWDPNSNNPTIPYVYKTPRLPFYDENLRNLARKIKSHCLLTHIRGVSYNEDQVVSSQNVHPFIFKGFNISLAHNGSLADFGKMKLDLLNHISPNLIPNIHGTTDSELIYALFLSQLSSPIDSKDINNIIDAILKTFNLLKEIRHKHGIAFTSPINLFITNGEAIVATRFAMDFGHYSDSQTLAHLAYHSLWYTAGESYGFYDNEYKMKLGDKKSCIIIASEPLTKDTSSWVEVPESTLIATWLENNEVKIISKAIPS